MSSRLNKRRWLDAEDDLRRSKNKIRELRTMLVCINSYLTKCPFCLAERYLGFSEKPNPIGWEYFIDHRDDCKYRREIRGVFHEDDKV